MSRSARTFALLALALGGCRSVAPTPSAAPFEPDIAYGRPGLDVPVFADGVTCQQHTPPTLDLSAPPVRAALRELNAYFPAGSASARQEIVVRHTLLVDTTGHVVHAYSRGGIQVPLGQHYRGWHVGAAVCDGAPVTSSVDLNLMIRRG